MPLLQRYHTLTILLCFLIIVSCTGSAQRGSHVMHTTDSFFKSGIPDTNLQYQYTKQHQFQHIRQDVHLKKIYIAVIVLEAIISLAIVVIAARVIQNGRINYREAQKRNNGLKIALSELENANRKITHIMRVMAHDLRTPLTGIIGLANIVKDDAEIKPETDRIVNLIETNGTRTLNMIDELLKTGLADEKESFETRPFDLTILLMDVIELLKLKAEEKQLKVDFEYSAREVIIEICYEKMWRVFINILGNAIKFSHRGGNILVSVNLNIHERLVVVAIQDYGIGIPEKEQSHVFEMFTEARRLGTDGEKSFGMGMSISQKIVEQHNGRIWFKSQPDQGTTFFVELPA